MGLSVYDERQPIAAYAQIAHADTTAWKLLYGTYLGAIRADMIVCRSGSASAAVVRLAIYTNGSYAQLGSVSVPAASGNGGTPGVNLLATLLALPLDGLCVATSVQLAVAVEVTLGAGEFIDVLLLGGLV